MKKKKKGLIFAILSFVMIALILAIGGKKYMDTRAHEKNFANQRQAALSLKKFQSHATKVVFTSEGSQAGFGVPWTVGAKMTTDGEVFNISLEREGDYSINLGKDGNNYKSNKLKKIRNKKNSYHDLEVIYSNGKREVIK